MKRKLSRKISLTVTFILLIVISAMVFFSYQTFKEFYKEHLAHEVEEELRSYTKMIEGNLGEEIISFLVLEKNRERHVHMVYFDKELQIYLSSHDISNEWLEEYRNWIKSHDRVNGKTIEYVDTGIDFHIPHIWAFQPVIIDGSVSGYFFIDKDTGEFEKAKVQLLLLLFAMGLFTLFVGILLTNYLTKIISKPLIKISETTREIAKGDFDTELLISGEDEVGQLAEDIRSMKKQLKEYRDSRRQFISHISHDLRTPITYIKGYSAVMKDTPVVNEQDWRRNLDVIYQEAKRMEFLVSDLFQLTKLEEGRITLHKEKINLISWIESIVASRQLMLDNQLISCKVQSQKQNIYAFIDTQRLGQALINFFENSIRYTPKKGSIIINVSESKWITIEITDNGIGISEEDLPHIWERFYRVDKSRSRESGGSGLGLAIVKEIVEVHGGTVDVQSKEKIGTSFFINIPKEDCSNS